MGTAQGLRALRDLRRVVEGCGTGGEVIDRLFEISPLGYLAEAAETDAGVEATGTAEALVGVRVLRGDSGGRNDFRADAAADLVAQAALQVRQVGDRPREQHGRDEASKAASQARHCSEYTWLRASQARIIAPSPEAVQNRAPSVRPTRLPGSSCRPC